MRYISLEECTPEIYAKMGLMSGLEVHQQLLTEKKLFCRCPAGLYSRHWDAEILRHMRPTLSELGEYDGTALMEFKTKKNITYRINKATVCTYEFDDTPPFEVNEDALDIGLEMCLMLQCSLVSELHIARKQYLDGSIPTGFQRTAILGVDGWIPFEGRRIGIRQLAVEEDSCREFSDIGHNRIYITDRLGMPLMETVTEPDMKTPREVAAVCQLLRRLARSMGKVRTGAGAGREDVNVSVRGGNRCEIKGVPSIRRIPLLVHNEAFRQAALLELKDILAGRGITAESFQSKELDVTERLRETRFTPIVHALADGMRVHGVLLKGYEGILKHSLGPGRSFLQEISDRVRVIACTESFPNIICTDIPEGTLSASAWLSVRKALGARTTDAVVLVWGREEDAVTGGKEIVIRAREATLGVPLETRQALPDGTTGFERILPGAERMYPDTDLPPKPIQDQRIHDISSRLPKRPWELQEAYRSAGMPLDLAAGLSISPFAKLYDSASGVAGVRPAFLASLVLDRLKGLRRKGLELKRLDPAFLREALSLYAQGKLMRGGLILLIQLALKGELTAPGEGIERLGLKPAAEAEVSVVLRETLQKVRGLEFEVDGDRLRYAMGLVMRRIGPRVDGRVVSERLQGSLDAKEVAR